MGVRRFVGFLFVLLLPSLLKADAPGVYAIRGGTVHPASGPPVANGIVVIRAGLIEAAGASVPIPPDATIIDVPGAHVYPGLIDAQTSLGAVAPKDAEPTADTLAVNGISLSDDDLDARRAIGVTTIITAPATGIFNGQSAILNLGAGDPQSRVVKNSAALQVAFNPRATWTYPDSLMGVIAFLRQTFLDASRHSAAREVYERSPSGLQRPEANAALDAIVPVMRREMPVVFVADTAEMMRRAQAIAHEFNLRYVIAGARQGYRMPGELKEAPVLVSVRWPVAPADRDDREDQPLRVIRDRQLAPATPLVLANAGVTFALVSGSGKTGDFLPGIRKAIENGLTPEDALKATTLTPARIFGVDRQLGSLERGKIANVVVSDAPLFDAKARVTHVFIDGRETRLPKGEKKDAPSAGSPIDGTWALSVRSAQGNVAIQVTLHAEDGKLTGTFSGERGSGDIRGGSFDGRNVSFSLAGNAQNAAEATDWVFTGKVDGDSMSGTVATTLGTFEFSGSRSK